MAPPDSTNALEISWSAFRDAALDVVDFVQTQRRVPSRVFIGAEAVAPADFLVAMANAYGKAPGAVRIGSNTELLTARHVAKDTPGLFGGWIIHKSGFRAPKVLEIARLQAWTLKPALRQ
jgi:hypothetical protein